MGASEGTEVAPSGQVWVCGACGKRAKSRYGFDQHNKSTLLDHGFDESCVLNAVLCLEERNLMDGSWVPVVKVAEGKGGG